MNDKVFTKESFKILNGIAAFKDDSVDDVENVEVYSKVNVDSWVEKLQAEIERLKDENKDLKSKLRDNGDWICNGNEEQSAIDSNQSWGIFG